MVFGLLGEETAEDMEVGPKLSNRDLQHFNFLVSPHFGFLFTFGFKGMAAGVTGNGLSLAERFFLFGLLRTLL